MLGLLLVFNNRICVQWGKIWINTDAYATVTLPITMADANYNVCLCGIRTNTPNSADLCIDQRTTSTFILRTYFTAGDKLWRTIGWI